MQGPAEKMGYRLGITEKEELGQGEQRTRGETAAREEGKERFAPSEKNKLQPNLTDFGRRDCE